MTQHDLPKEFTATRYRDGKVIDSTEKLPATLGPKDVVLKITHSGVCHTDLAFAKYGSPASLGHEGVGVVAAVGDAVTKFKVGDVAGAGFQRYACGECEYCLTGRDTRCERRVIFGINDVDHGTFGQYYVGTESFIFRIPEGMAPEHASPLQCAGATVYAALVDNAKPRSRVGVIGVGGLGHLAVQFAAKMGMDVVVFSTTAAKEAEARAFGASEFVLLDRVEEISAPVQVLLLTGAKYPDWSRVLKKEVLARDGIIVPLLAPSGDLVLPANNIFWDQYHVHSSLVATRAQHQDMLDFAARNGIKPTIELYPKEGPQTVEKIFENLEKGTVRYRAVLVL